MRKDRWTETVIIGVISSFLALYFGLRVGMLVELQQAGARPDVPLIQLLWNTITDIWLNPIAFSNGRIPTLIAIVFFTLAWIVFVALIELDKPTRPGEEFGSGRRGNWREARGYADPGKFSNNLILSKHTRIAINENERVKKSSMVKTIIDGEERSITARNTIVLGGTGSGKTIGYVIPNLLQMIDEDTKSAVQRDIVVVDTKGTAIKMIGATLVKAGVSVSNFNTVNKELSDIHNIFENFKTDSEINELVNMIVANTNNGRSSNDPIWDNGEKLWMRSLITTMRDYFPPEMYTLSTMLRLSDMCSTESEDFQSMCAMDYFFEQIETGRKRQPIGARKIQPSVSARTGITPAAVNTGPSKLVRRDGRRPADVGGFSTSEDEALKLWKEFRASPQKTMLSFIISLHARFSDISNPDVLKLLGSQSSGQDELRLELLGQTHDAQGNELPPRVVFVTTSDYDGSLNALLSIVMWEATFLPTKAADRTTGSLPRPLTLIYDEFRAIGKINNLPATINVIRSRNIDMQILLQAYSQLENIYDKEAEAIRGGCPSLVVLGGGRVDSTAEKIEKSMGDETITRQDTSKRTGFGGDASISTTSMARKTFTAHEISTLKSNKALVLIGDVDEYEDDKFALATHPNYDPEYMAQGAKKRFDYVAWKEAGKPLGEDAKIWEEAYWEFEGRLRVELDELRLSTADINNERMKLERRVKHIDTLLDKYFAITVAKLSPEEVGYDGPVDELERVRLVDEMEACTARIKEIDEKLPVVNARLAYAQAKARAGLFVTLSRLKRFTDDSEQERVKNSVLNDVKEAEMRLGDQGISFKPFKLPSLEVQTKGAKADESEKQG